VKAARYFIHWCRCWHALIFERKPVMPPDVARAHEQRRIA
jgi:hypothetical protein